MVYNLGNGVFIKYKIKLYQLGSYKSFYIKNEKEKFESQNGIKIIIFIK